MKKYMAPLLLTLAAALPLQAADISSFVMVDHRLSPKTTIGYFDHEGHSPFKGDARSTITRTGDGLRLNFDMKATKGAFCGWYVSVREHSVDFGDKNVLRFELKGSADVPTDRFQIGIRTSNIPADDNAAKITLAELGYTTFPTEFTSIEIPVSVFQEREPGLDLARASQLIIMSIVEPDQDLANAEVTVRNARWSWDVEKKEGGYVASLPDSLFETMGGGFKEGAKPYLDRIAEVAGSHAWEVHVKGHTRVLESESANRWISTERARAVADFLENAGVLGDIYTTGMTVLDPAFETGVPVNDRVDILILARK